MFRFKNIEVMKNHVSYIFGFALLIIAGLSISLLTGSSNGMVGNSTGMPGAGTCANCHGPLNSGGITVTGFPATYSQGITYSITVSITQATSNNGFQGVIVDGNNVSVGNLTAGAGSQTVSFGGNQFIAHNSPSTSGSWTFDWVAPAPSAGPLTMYVAANAADGNGVANAGDIIYADNFSSQPASALSASVSGFDATCNGVCDGSASVSASGGNAPYSFSWSSGNTPAAHPDSVENLCGGTHFVTVYDVQNDSVVDTFNINEPLPISFQAAVENTSCVVDSGSISLTFTGGASPHTVNWTGPNSYTNTGASIFGLRAGEYIAAIQDNNGCSTTDTVIVQDTASGIEVNVTTVPPGCNSSTGSITLSAQNGTPPYTYFWADGQSTATISNLVPGVYFVTVSESGRFCTKELAITLMSANAPQVTNAEIEDVICHGESTGSISLTVSSNNPPLSYSWSDPSATGDNPTGLPAGTYTVSITDNDDCTAIESYVVNEPSNPFNLIANITDDSGNCSGSIDLSVSGNNAAAGFTAQWDTPDQDTGTLLTDLCAGNYRVTVTDVEGCTTVESYEVQDADTSGNGGGNGGSNSVDEIQFKDEIKMYPNPAVDRVFIEFPGNDVVMNIFDIKGKLIETKVLTSNRSDVPLNLTSGMYFVQFISDTERAIKRLIISK